MGSASRRRLLGHLEDICGLQASNGWAEATEVEGLLVAYRDFLTGERALAERSVDRYLWVAGRFLAWWSGRCGGELALGRLTAADVTAFVLAEHGRGVVASARSAVTGLRSLLSYLHVEGGLRPRVG